MITFQTAWTITVCFILLKLVGVVNLSWWWVLSPIWIYYAVISLIIAVTAILYHWSDDVDQI